MGSVIISFHFNCGNLKKKKKSDFWCKEMKPFVYFSSSSVLQLPYNTLCYNSDDIHQESTEHQRKHIEDWTYYHSLSGKSIIQNIKQYWHHQRLDSTHPVISAIKVNQCIGTWDLQGLLCRSFSNGEFSTFFWKAKPQNWNPELEFLSPVYEAGTFRASHLPLSL